MKNTERLKIEREWLEKALQIAEELPRGMFIYACIGKALQAPQWAEVEAESFSSWPEVQALWEKTKITPITKDKDGKIEWKKTTPNH